MTTYPIGSPRARRSALDHLLDGRAVIIPMPSPLPYAVAGTSPAVVNTAKGRPADQPSGMLVPDFDRVGPISTWLRPRSTRPAG